MIKSSINISVSKNLTEEITKSLKDLSSKTLCIGIPEEENVQVDDDTNTNNNKGKITNAQKLYLNTHGVRDKEMKKYMQKDLDKGTSYSKAHEMYVHEYGSPLHQVPPRPVLVPALEDGKEVIAELMKDAVVSALDGGNINTELSKVGMEGQSIVRDWFTSPKNNWAPNAQSTIDKKGSDKPLINTSEMMKSITYVIKEGEK